MKRRTKFCLVLFLMAGILMQTGCWDQKQYEDIGFILQMGLEKEKNKLLLSMTAPVVSPDVEKKVEFLYTSDEAMVRSSREKLRDRSGKMLQGGKIQILYFSKELAQEGINEYMDIFLRDPENPLLSNVVVVDKSPKEMMELSLDFKDKPRSAIYAAELLRDARRRLSIPETRIYNFNILYYSKTIDPVTPLFRYDDKNFIASGSAVFNGDKMVGEVDPDQTKLLNILIGKKQTFEYFYRESVPSEIKDTLKHGASIYMMPKKSKINVYIESKKPVLDLTLRFNASMDEFSGKNKLDQKGYQDKVEKAVSQALYNDIYKLLTTLQQVGADPIGFGEKVRSTQNQYWKSVNWKEVYKSARIKLNVGVNIETYGTIR